MQRRIGALEGLYTRGVQVIEDRVNDWPELTHRLDFFKESCCWASPATSGSTTDSGQMSLTSYPGFFPKRYQNPETPLFLIPLLPEDRGLGPRWQEIYDKPGMMVYTPQLHAVCFRVNIIETTVCRASALLHDLGHAMRALEGGRVRQADPRTLDEKLQEEVDMHLFEAELWGRLGDESYSVVMTTAMGRVEDDFRRSQQVRFVQLPSFAETLGIALGALPHGASQNDRDTQFSIAAHLRAHAASRERQVEIMRLIYERVGHTM